MEIIFSNHSLEQIRRRQISEQTVLEIVQNPELVIEKIDITIYQAKRTVNEKVYLFRIFVNNLKKPSIIITVYRTSKIKKYES